MLLWGQRRDFLDPLKDALKAEGLRGIRAGASVEAALADAAPHLIVVDAADPAIDAPRLVEQLSQAVPLTPLLWIVPPGDAGSVAIARALGVAHFAEEPYSPAVLAGRLRALAEIQPGVAAGGVRDGLTGLSSRVCFLENMERLLERARLGKHRAALLYIDLDRFKAVNDALGHSVGDALLRRVARVLEHQIRPSDLLGSGREHLANDASRLGGDEFAVLLSRLGDPADAAAVAQRIQQSLRIPFSADGYQVASTASVGISIFPDDAEDATSMLRCADLAMYAAKASGRGASLFYQSSMARVRVRRLQVERNLRSAIERGELELRFQPRVTLDEDRICGMEALLRWHSAELGDVPPKEFIPIAEESGLIVPIGAWVLETACRQMAAWQRQGLEGFRISVNVSSRQFADGNLVETVTDALRDAGVGPEALELEVTERLMLGDDENVSLALRDLRGIGVTLALDDFGTGYSSLSCITTYPLDVLKIDRSIAGAVKEDPAAASIVAAVVTLARSLGLGVVAEGADDLEQARLVAQLGCDELQGFVIAPALPAETFADFVANWRGLEACKGDYGDTGSWPRATGSREDLPTLVPESES